MTDMNAYFSQLIGFEIIGFRMVEDESALSPFPCFTVKSKSGEVLQVEVSQDAEGNGGGFLFISQPQAAEATP